MLIAGLGNPTSRYEKTRHNAGFWFLDELANGYGARFKPESRFGGELARIERPGLDLWLLKPMTYMNRSGGPIRLVSQYFKIPLTEILVVHDELDLSPGDVRLKKAGGHGGHNGLRDIISVLGTPDFLRLRLGIGHPGEKSQVVDYVLGEPGKAERDQINQAIADTLPKIVSLAEGKDLQSVIAGLHTGNKK